jgi:LPS export ABC transporter protein LptC
MSRSRRVFLLAVAAAVALGAADPGNPGSGAALTVTGMTFVGSRDADSEVVLRARRAFFHPSRNVAELEDVRATVNDDEQGRSFEMTCNRAELDFETNDFSAEGDVVGVTGDGQRYSADWVRYEDETGLLYTDAPVLMVDDTGTFRGDGFRYHVKERRFKLVGNVSVVQGP